MGDPVDELLARADAGELGDPLPVLAYLAGEGVELDESELNGARRRALLLVAAGGRALDAIVLRVRDLPRAREAALFLAADVDLAWRLWALALLAEELGG